jgi:phage baseplate assembly protein W
MSEKKIIGKDLKLKFDELGVDLAASEGDFDTVKAEYNLAQAIIHRLAIGEGELYDVGHADYGSHLQDLIGEPNNGRTRMRVENLVRDCLTQEPRIREVSSVNVNSRPDDPNSLDIEITVLPIGSDNFLSVVYPFNLEVE